MNDEQLRDLQNRVESDPTAYASQFELGVELLRRGRARDAIVHLCVAQGHSVHRLDARRALSDAFESLGLRDLAEKYRQHDD